MLSPGLRYKDVPKDREENLEFRRFWLQKAHGNRQVQRGLLAACRRDILFWINTFVWQYNPNSIGDGSAEVGPFITWGFQDAAFMEILDAIERRKDLVVEKSREMGATWKFLLAMDWQYLFSDWKKFLAISRSAEAVDDKADSDSLFWKLDFIHEHLPDWMVGGRVKRRKMGFVNPLTNSRINGQASTGKAGVGGRATAMFIDEFSQINEDYLVLDRTSDTTGCRMFNFTHIGLQTAAYEISQRVDMRKLVLHWTQHPDKVKGLYRYDPEQGKVEVLDKTYPFAEGFRFVMDGSPTGGPFPGVRSPWYDDQCRRKGSARAIAMDLDIDPKGSVSQFFDRLMILQLQTAYAVEPYWEGDLHFDSDSGRPLSLVPGKGGPLRLWLTIGSPHTAPDATGLRGPRPALDSYGMGCDIATGTGATPSCCSVTNAQGEKVASYRNAHILPERFAPLVAALGWLFISATGEPALVAWEVPGPGYTFGNRFMELGYRNVYYKKDEFKEFADATDVPGWYASPNNKRALLEDYRAALNARQFLNRCREALSDCLAFRYDKRGQIEHSAEAAVNDPSGARVNHADVVIADALSWKMAKTFGVSAPKKVVDRAPVLSLQWRRELHARLEREEEYA